MSCLTSERKLFAQKFVGVMAFGRDFPRTKTSEVIDKYHELLYEENSTLAVSGVGYYKGSVDGGEYLSLLHSDLNQTPVDFVDATIGNYTALPTT
jgi:hypothetical protein